LALALLAFIPALFGEIVEIRDPALAMTVFRTAKPHDVKVRKRLAFHKMRLTPYVTQRFDRSETKLGVALSVVTSWDSFTFAPVIVTSDGRQLGQLNRNWVVGREWEVSEKTSIEDDEIVRGMASGTDVFLTLLFPNMQAPFDRISFKLLPEQLADLRQMAAKYDELRK
jgi:hypothetical protein